MHQAGKVSLCLVIVFSFAASLFAAPKKEYFTEDELDLIRDAQELSQRVPVYFKLAERRLIFLGLMEKSEKEKEKERKEKEKREKEKKKAFLVGLHLRAGDRRGVQGNRRNDDDGLRVLVEGPDGLPERDEFGLKAVEPPLNLLG